MDNMDFSATSDLENLISQTKFERIFFLCGKKKKSYYSSRTYRTIKKILKKKNNKVLFQKFIISRDS